MLKDKNIGRFESELKKVNRPGMDKLLAYIRKSDFYSAPASTRYHLSCEGGLMQHSLNVLDALRGLMLWNITEHKWSYSCANKFLTYIPDESVTIMALLHDLCKTHYYKTSTRNVKNEQTGKWEKAPFYTVEDKMPLGHGSKSAMLPEDYVENLKKEYTGVFYERFILGKWVAAQGAVYDMLDQRANVYQPEDRPVDMAWSAARTIAVDYGTSNPTVFLDVYDNGQTVRVDREYRWDSQERYRQKTDGEYAEDLAAFMGESPCAVMVDPAAASFITELQSRGGM